MHDTLPRMVFTQARRHPERPALRYKEQGHYRDVSWAALDATMTRFARALLALGIERGQRVALMAPNGPTWVYADLGALTCGAVSVPIYHTAPLPAVRHILDDSQSSVLFVHSPQMAGQLAELRPTLPRSQWIVLLEGTPEDPAILTLRDFLALGDALPDATLATRQDEVQTTDLASLVYTSGTTGPPKGVMLSHANFLANIRACLELFQVDERDECLSFLPLAHAFERMTGYYLMLDRGATIAYAENVNTLMANLAEVRPTLFIGVPRVYEKAHARIMARVGSGSRPRQRLFLAALGICRREALRTAAGQPLPPLARALSGLLRKTLFAGIRDHFGGRLRFFVSGGAPLDREIAEFFLAVGLPIYEGYGLTETAPVVAANAPGHLRPGTVGRVVPGTQVKLAEDGEIWVKGPGVFAGYWRRPEETTAAFVDGWFKTGDVGVLDGDGYLTITDRKKDLIVTAGGENISPQTLETLCKSDYYIANALVYGEGKPYLTALLVPDLDHLAKFARAEKLAVSDPCALVRHPRCLALIRDRLNRAQAELPSFQRIKRFTLLSRDFPRQEGALAGKLQRQWLIDHFRPLLEGMYQTESIAQRNHAFCVVDPPNPEATATSALLKRR